MKAPRYCPQCRTELAVRQLDERERLACPVPECDFVVWDNPTPVVAAIVERDGEIILGRNRAWPEKMFGLVTGFLERDEEPADAAMREVSEELGLTSSDPSLVGVYGFAQMNQVIIAYHLNARGDVQLGEELAAYKAIPIVKLKAWPAATGLAVADWLRSWHEKRSAQDS